MINWPSYNGKLVGTVLRSSSWDTTAGVLAEQTRSGKYKVRSDHIKVPDTFNINMHMTLAEYRVFRDWWINTCRKGVYSFGYPKINDNTAVITEYEFIPEKNPSIQNTSADNLEISMAWREVS